MKSTFNACQDIDYLRFIINSIKMTVSLTPATELGKEQVPQ